MILENKVQILHPMYSLHEKQSKRISFLSFFLNLSVKIWLHKTYPVSGPHCVSCCAFSQCTHFPFVFLQYMNLAGFLTFFSPPHFHFLEKVLSSWGNNDIEEDSVSNQYTISISTSEQERWKGNNELRIFCFSFTPCWLKNMGKKFK